MNNHSSIQNTVLLVIGKSGCSVLKLVEESNTDRDLPIHCLILDTVSNLTTKHLSVPLELTAEEWEGYLNAPAEKGAAIQLERWYDAELLRLHDRDSNGTIDSRMYARLLLLHPGNFQVLTDYLQQIVRRIPHAYASEAAPQNGGGSDAGKPLLNIYVVGDLGDGLCAGIVSDLGPILSHELAHFEIVRYGLFMMPHETDTEPRRQNAYQVLREFNHYDYLSGVRQGDPFGRSRQVGGAQRPMDIRSEANARGSSCYDMTFLVIPTSPTGVSDRLERTSAEYLINMLSAARAPHEVFYDRITELRKTSGRQNHQMPAFSIVCCSTVQYPDVKALHSQLTSQATRNVVATWLDAKVTWIPSPDTPLPYTIIKADDKQEGALRKVFKTASYTYAEAWQLFETSLEEAGKKLLGWINLTEQQKISNATSEPKQGSSVPKEGAEERNPQLSTEDDEVGSLIWKLNRLKSRFSWDEYANTSFATRSKKLPPGNSAKQISVDPEVRRVADEFADHLTKMMMECVDSHLFQSKYGPSFLALVLQEIKSPCAISFPSGVLPNPGDDILSISLEHQRSQLWSEWQEDFQDAGAQHRETITSSPVLDAYKRAKANSLEARKAYEIAGKQREIARKNSEDAKKQQEAARQGCEVAQNRHQAARRQHDTAQQEHQAALGQLNAARGRYADARRHQETVLGRHAAARQRHEAAKKSHADAISRHTDARNLSTTAQNRSASTKGHFELAVRNRDDARIRHNKLYRWLFWSPARRKALNNAVQKADNGVLAAEYSVQVAENDAKTANSNVQLADTNVQTAKNGVQAASTAEQAAERTLQEANQAVLVIERAVRAAENSVREAAAAEQATEITRLQAIQTVRDAETAVRAAEHNVQVTENAEQRAARTLQQAKQAGDEAEKQVRIRKEAYVEAVHDYSCRYALAGFKLVVLDCILFDARYGAELAQRFEPVQSFLKNLVVMTDRENKSQAPISADPRIVGFSLPERTVEELNKQLKDQIIPEITLSEEQQAELIGSLRLVEGIARAMLGNPAPNMASDLARMIIESIRMQVEVGIKTNRIEFEAARSQIDEIALQGLIQGSASALGAIPLHKDLTMTSRPFEVALILSNDPNRLQEQQEILKSIHAETYIVPSQRSDRISFVRELHGVSFTHLVTLLKVLKPPFLDSSCARRDVSWLLPGMPAKEKLQEMVEIWMLTLCLKKSENLINDVGWYEDGQSYYLDFAEGGQTLSYDFSAAVSKLARGEYRRHAAILSSLCRESIRRLSLNAHASLLNQKLPPLGYTSEHIKSILQIAIRKHS